ncbi:isoprenylcysteine carboxylmethyltransferase family protein [Micromonospora sp. WMMD1120]|uniref:methyltransferase family protein n=1 Tax=Micromonospora sp. WMMD1120 TaxID=3016106 RepID=UPI002415EBCB|nr:isoprenylcysteine carboxylmethyltransferase family protein [Micromonospora sp. WMMD1120]MDG4807601.1 isoprenylcysteine carboxylmethyltransferase family protein [Micromonospora sp. WMMD1120]
MIAVAALTVYVAWLVLAFGLRSLIQARRTGDAGWRSPGGKRGSLQWWSRIIVGFGAVAAGLAAPVADLIGLPAIGILDQTWLRLAGLALAIVAAAATVVAQIMMGRSWRIGVDEAERTTLVTTGPFRLVRNPIFTAAVVVIAGTALAVPNAIALAGLAAAIIGVQLQVRRIEEPYLRRVHGEDYDRYAAHVGRFLPGIGKPPSRGDHTLPR